MKAWGFLFYWFREGSFNLKSKNSDRRRDTKISAEKKSIDKMIVTKLHFITSHYMELMEIHYTIFHCSASRFTFSTGFDLQYLSKYLILQ
jgi:hypothetical protein